MDVLLRIKRLVVRGLVRFTEKARLELEADGLEPEDALEAILSAPAYARRCVVARDDGRPSGSHST